MLIANLTLLPALLALMGRAVFWPLIPKPGQTRRSVWGAVASRVVGRPVLTLVIGVTAFGGLALAVLDYSPAGFGAPTVSATSDSARGQAALTAHFASAQSNPTNVVFRHALVGVATPRGPGPGRERPPGLGGLQRRGRRARAHREGSGVHARAAGPALRAPSGPRNRCPVVAPSTSKVPAQAYEAYRATAQFVSADGRTILYDTSLTAGGPETGRRAQRHPARPDGGGVGGDAHRGRRQRRGR